MALPFCAALAIAQLVIFVSVAGVVSGLDEQHSYYEGNYGTTGLVFGSPDSSRTSWDYTNLKDWPTLCLTGRRQSPISFANVNPDEVVMNALLQRLQFSSKCVFPREETQMRIINEGIVSTVSFEELGRSLDDMSECTVMDPLNRSLTYHFTGLHFHAMPVHQLRTLRPDAEMHMSFTTNHVEQKMRNVLIVAVMLKASAMVNSTSARALQHILVDGSLPKRNAMTTCFLTESLSLFSLIPARESYLLYDGSQTHPPCTENVRWVVMTSPILISPVALGRLRDAMDALLPNDFHRFGNARPPQALNGRLIFRFDDRSVPDGGNRGEGNFKDAWSRKDEGWANRSLGVRAGRVLEGSLVEVDGDYKYDSAVVVSPVSPNPVSASRNGTTHASSPPITTSPGRYNGSSDQAMAKPGTGALGPAYMANASRTGPETHSHVNESDADYSNATANASLAPRTSVVSSASASSADESMPSGLHHGSESSAPTPSDESAPRSTTTSTTTTTTTTKEPSGTKGKKRYGDGASKNTSEADAGVVDSVKSIVTRAFTSVKAFSIGAFQSSVAYAKANPVRAVLVLLCIIVLIFLISTCCRGWRRPVYVVGIDPTELQPLNSAKRFDLYGGTGTGTVAVR
ncbi:carbonic anhydrase-like protein [Leishmania infantum JPCM5]|uniref:carbonic anhydrase n=2 Tax=Leishmania infantum TaxID=5671 RepID=A0A6L0XMC5_LEIIN|nr:carbonic anhydrase-like protein [Leishmania infantum JPCM5]CAC9501730.1 carbonic_anhydrase-like_protein [Leishmania infantum]CAM69254.1 carbonic anhydrase-like protein [Leishmania infantum JPCM5]SUZ43189.1 carbonic_anhydrase-like_protein [Leishmania infantum]|eukprot:XP_001470062.1 carbonic anhydrase-like protein [Leishmania infantum JPCM5]